MRAMKDSSSIEKIQHIPNLADNRKCAEMLERLRAEFGPIVEKRGWRVLSLTEMCCCGDGDAHFSSSGGKKRSRGRGRIMGHNVGGYNMARGDARTSLGIHIRLRRPKSHTLLPYEEVSNVMAHELAHITVGSHSAEFYELMHEIVLQHAKFVNSGQVLDKDGFPMGEKSHRLGGLSRRLDTIDVRTRAVTAAENRAKLTRIIGGSNILGGARREQKGKVSSREAALMAAEQRLEDSKWCHPVSETDIIEILDDEGSDDENNVLICQPVQVGRINDLYEKKKKPKNAPKEQVVLNADSVDIDVVDLTTDNTKRKAKSGLHNKQNRKLKKSSQVHRETKQSRGVYVCGGRSAEYCRSQSCVCNVCYNVEEDEPQSIPLAHKAAVEGNISTDWECAACTCLNPVAILACFVCGNPKLSCEESQKAVDGIIKHDFVKNVKTGEVQRSLDTFNGFNIYGNGSKKASTMNHLT